MMGQSFRQDFFSALRSIRRNKVRSLLSGAGVAWGVFLLMLFLSVGNGFQQGVMQLLSGFSRKSLFVYGGVVSQGTQRCNAGAPVRFAEGMEERLRQRYPGLVACSPEWNLPGAWVSHGGEVAVADVKGVTEAYFSVKTLSLSKGRCLSTLDDKASRPVAIIGEGLEQRFFGKGSALGGHLLVQGFLAEVVGVISSGDLFSLGERNAVYLPASVFLSHFSSDHSVPALCLALDEASDASAVERDLRGYLAHRQGFAPHDQRALFIANMEAQTQLFDKLFSGIKALVWLLGACLLASGAVGVGNVMLVLVKERTPEMGIRKAVGATSGGIIRLVLAESALVTVCSGVVGILLGFAAVGLLNGVVLRAASVRLLQHVRIDPMAVALALVVLCICGLAAGVVPALRAAHISPASAIRYENRG